MLTLASMLLDGTSPFEMGKQGVFGWPTDLRYLPSIAWLAAGPGVLGHTSLAALLKWMHPLQVSVFWMSYVHCMKQLHRQDHCRGQQGQEVNFFFSFYGADIGSLAALLKWMHPLQVRVWS